MRYRELGRTGVEVSVICQGCWSLVTDDFNWGRNDVRDSLAAIGAALDAGVNFFDTAEGYGGGESEQILGRALGRHRREVIIASKVAGAHLRAADLVKSCEQSLRHLATDYIDLYQVHWPNPDVPLEETLAAMEQLREAGKIRFAGLSNFGVSYLAGIGPRQRVESNQLCYSLLWRAIEHRVQPACIERGLGILCYSPLAQGLLTGKFATADEVPALRARTRHFAGDRPHARHGEAGFEAETFRALERLRAIAADAGEPLGALSLAWLLSRPGVTSVIAGSRNAEQARKNAAAGDREPSPAVLEALTAATDEVKRLVGTNCDMWQHDSRLEKKSPAG